MRDRKIIGLFGLGIVTAGVALLTVFTVHNYVNAATENCNATAVGSYQCTFNSSGSFTAPPRTVNLTAVAWGGGGGGGGARHSSGTNGARGGGGGSGAYTIKNFGNFQLGGGMSVTVGGGGSGGTANSSSANNGSAGGASSATFNSVTVTAGGGAGGAGASGNNVDGAGGNGGASSGGDGGSANGNAGGNGQGTGNGSGTGGAAPNGGGGGASVNPGTGTQAGNIGGTPGGGGSGAKAAVWVNVNDTGGAGGAGRVIVYYDIAPEPVVKVDPGTTRIIYSGGTVSVTGSGFQNGGVGGTMTFTGATITANGTNVTGSASVSSNTALTLTAPAISASNIAADANASVVFHYTDQYGFTYDTASVSLFTYVPAASDFTLECYDPMTSSWSATPYVNSGVAMNCRVTFNNPYNGTLTLQDVIPNTGGNLLGGTFSPSSFNLTYAGTMTPTNQTVNFTYTPPSFATIDALYNGTNGFDIFWPNITATANLVGGPGTARSKMIGIIGEKIFVAPTNPTLTPSLGSSYFWNVSTHGAPYFGLMSFVGTDDLSQSDDPTGPPGVFATDAIGGTTIDFSTLDGNPEDFSYTPAVTGLICINPTITNGAAIEFNPSGSNCIDVEESLVIVADNSASENLLRGATGNYTLTVPDGWAGTVLLADRYMVGGGAVGGVITDTSTGPNPTGTYNPSLVTFTFSGAPGTNVRTFSYTMPNRENFDSYRVSLMGVRNDNPTIASVIVNVVADKLTFQCGTGYTTCGTGFVGQSQDYDIIPNGLLIGDVDLEMVAIDNGGGAVGAPSYTTISFNSSNPFTVGYNPPAPGERAIKATISSSVLNPSLVGQEFLSSDQDFSSIGAIYVRANESTITGPTVLSNGKSGNYTLTLNGPFMDTIDFNAILSDLSAAGGTFSPTSCTFDANSYDGDTNTTSCTFTYTPPTFSDTTVVTLSGNKQPSYTPNLLSNGLNVTVHPPLTITGISPAEGPEAGGTDITISGKGFINYVNGVAINPHTTTVTLDVGGIGETSCSVLSVSDTAIVCTTGPRIAGTVSVTVNNGWQNDVWTVADGGFKYIGIYLSLSSSDVSYTVYPGNQNSDYTIAKVTTNNSLGYKIMMSGASSNLVCSNVLHSDWVIPSIQSESAFGTTDSRWGFNISTGSAVPSTWKPIPTGSGTMIWNNPTASGPLQDGNVGDDRYLHFGTYVDFNQPACVYEQTLTITAIAN